jgi:hypothetical protein
MCFDCLEASATTIDNVFGVKDSQFNLSDKLTIEASHPIINLVSTNSSALSHNLDTGRWNLASMPGSVAG